MKKMTKELLEELNEVIQNNKEFHDGYCEDTDYPFITFVTSQYSNRAVKSLGNHTFKFRHMGLQKADLKFDTESYDNQQCEWVFDIDGVTYAVYGYYSSYEHSEIDTYPVEVKLAERTVNYYEVVV